MDENSKERLAGGDTQTEKVERHWRRVTENCLRFDFGFADHLPTPQFTYCMWLFISGMVFPLFPSLFPLLSFFLLTQTLSCPFISQISPTHIPGFSSTLSVSVTFFSPTPEQETHLRPPLCCCAHASSQRGVLRGCSSFVTVLLQRKTEGLRSSLQSSGVEATSLTTKEMSLFDLVSSELLDFCYLI